MSEQDQLEHDVEAALARLVTRAVPDTAAVPAPPWQQPRRAVDPRRFGRATPWLVAAVLLVIAGLGAGATVAFDAGGPDRAPVATEPPSPSATSIVSDGTLGDPTTTPTPTSTPSFDRGTGSAVVPPVDGISTSAAPPDGPFVIGAGTYGPITVGSDEAAALAALGLSAADESQVNPCYRTILSSSRATTTGAELVVSATSGGVFGVTAPFDAVDGSGHGVGTTLATLRAAYANGTVIHSESGYIFLRPGANETGTGYVLSTDLGASAAADTDVVQRVQIGTSEWAQGFELYCNSPN